MLKYALTGNPLGHSLSSIIHNEILSIKKIKGNYELKPTDNLEKSFKEDLSHLNGFNVTIPYKKDILKYLDFKSDKVKLYDSCNTVKIEDSKVSGYNTDVYGILDTLKKHSIDVKNKKVLVSGNGGVSSMIACEMALLNAEVFITARNKEKAHKLIEDIYNKTGKKIKFIEKEEIGEFYLFIQGTPLGMYPDIERSYLPLTKLKDISFVFDTIYNPYKTLTLRISEYYGNKGIGGLNMLVEQAVKAQEIFNGITLEKQEFNKVLNKAKRNIPKFKIERNIVLIGPPGCGKTTISREIASLLDMDIFDVDLEIVKKEKKSINEIFEKYGEEYFRKVEKEVFYKGLNKSGCIIATGGGLPLYNNLETLKKEENTVVFLNVDKNVIFDRISKDDSRPLLKNDKKNALFELIEKRQKIYEKSAHIKINVEKEQNIKDTVADTLEKIFI